MYVNGEPLYPFGHGLTYTNFEYSVLKMSADKVKADGNTTASIEITSSVKRPVKELRGFQRVSLKVGETKTVTLALPASKLAFWDEKTHGFLVEPGAYDVMVGASSADIRLKSQVEVIQ